MEERERKREQAEQRNATYSTNGHNENRQHAVVFDTCLDSYPLLILQDRLLWIGPWESFPLICKKDIATIASKDGRDLQEWLPLSRNHRNDRAIIHNQGRRGATARASSRNLVIILQLTSFQSRWPLKRRKKKTSGGEAVKDGSRLRRRRRGGGRGGNGGNESGTAKEEDGGKKNHAVWARIWIPQRERGGKLSVNVASCMLFVAQKV